MWKFWTGIFGFITLIAFAFVGLYQVINPIFNGHSKNKHAIAKGIESTDSSTETSNPVVWNDIKQDDVGKVEWAKVPTAQQMIPVSRKWGYFDIKDNKIVYNTSHTPLGAAFAAVDLYYLTGQRIYNYLDFVNHESGLYFRYSIQADKSNISDNNTNEGFKITSYSDDKASVKIFINSTASGQVGHAYGTVKLLWRNNMWILDVQELNTKPGVYETIGDAHIYEDPIQFIKWENK